MNLRSPRSVALPKVERVNLIAYAASNNTHVAIRMMPIMS